MIKYPIEREYFPRPRSGISRLAYLRIYSDYPTLLALQQRAFYTDDLIDWLVLIYAAERLVFLRHYAGDTADELQEFIETTKKQIRQQFDYYKETQL